MAPHSRHRHSRGQVVPIAALMAILLLAFVALAIDGGRGYIDRRDLQSTADMAALSGAAQLGTTFKTSGGAKKARMAAVNEAVNNLPGTSPPGGYNGTSDGVGLNLSNDYKMDVSATITEVHVKISHQLSLTFGVSAGFGPFITPAAEATAINGKVPFAVILFRSVCTTAIGNGCGNLINSGLGTTVNVTSSDYPTDTGDGLTNESVCPAVGTMDFNHQGNEYAFNPTGNGQFPSLACGNPNISNVRCTSGDPQNCVSPSIPMIAWSSQLTDPGYPEPDNSTLTTQSDPNVKSGSVVCASAGNYSSGITVQKGDLILQPGIYFIPSGGFKVSGNSSRVWTEDQYFSSNGTQPCGDHTVPADPGVIVEMRPVNTGGGKGAGDGSANQLTVSAAGTFNITASTKYDHIAIYIENTVSGESSNPNPTTDFSTTGGGSQVVTFGSGAVYNIKGAVYGYADNMSFSGGATTANGVGQILAWTVKLTGSGTLNQAYDPTNLPNQYGLLK